RSRHRHPLDRPQTVAVGGGCIEDPGREEPDGAVVAEYEVALQRGELAAPVANARYDHRPGLRAPLVLDHRIDQRLTPLPRVRTISGRVEEVVGVEAMRPLLDVPPVVATGFHPSDLLVAG